MKKAIALSLTVFSLCLLMTSCGNTASDSSKANETTTSATENITTMAPKTEKEEKTEKNNDKKTTDDTRHADENGIVGDVSEAIDTAIDDAGTVVSDIIDDIS